MLHELALRTLSRIICISIQTVMVVVVVVGGGGRRREGKWGGVRLYNYTGDLDFHTAFFSHVFYV